MQYLSDKHKSADALETPTNTIMDYVVYSIYAPNALNTMNSMSFFSLLSFIDVHIFLFLSLSCSFLCYSILENCKYHNFFPLVNETEYDPSIDEVLLGMYTVQWIGSMNGQLIEFNCMFKLEKIECVTSSPFNVSLFRTCHYIAT